MSVKTYTRTERHVCLEGEQPLTVFIRGAHVVIMAKDKNALGYWHDVNLVLRNDLARELAAALIAAADESEKSHD